MPVRRMRLAVVISCFFLTVASNAQTSSPAFTDAAALMDAVARNYASDAPSFHLESITETDLQQDLNRSWKKSFHTLIKASGNRFRLEAKTSQGTWLQASDGSTEWVYLEEAKSYIKRTAGSTPQFPKVYGMGTYELKQAWEMRTFLDSIAEHAKGPTILREETIVLAGTSYPCYVVHATNEGREFHDDETFWIEKNTLMFRKVVDSRDTVVIVSPLLKMPVHGLETTVYPVADLSPQADPKVFAFTPPDDAKEVADLEPLPKRPSGPSSESVSGKPAPDLSLTSANGKEVKLSSYRGRPLLIDVWATWCGPCLLWMPSLGKLESEMRSRGLQVISVDVDKESDKATHYMSIHGFTWPNYHDPQGKLGRAFGETQIPLTLLIDADGRLVFQATDSDEAKLRIAIDGLARATAKAGN
jgi:thiol-disulfide isomerase/thioredoxin/outer membrane lipoprotein-sorting protein